MSGGRAAIERLSLRCALTLVLALGGFALLIVFAKPALSAFVFGDVSGYLLVITVLILAIWALTWFYMARISAAASSDRDC